MSAKLFQSLDKLNPKSLKVLADQLSNLIEGRLWAKVLVGMALGIILGVTLSATGPLRAYVIPNQAAIDAFVSWLALPAKLFLKVIKMVIIPLIFSSIIQGLASTDNIAQMKTVGTRFAAFVLVTTCLGATLGIVLTQLLLPGQGLALKGAPVGHVPQQEAFFAFNPDAIISFLPSNPLASFVEGQMLDVVILSIIAGIAFLSIEKQQARGVMNILEIIQKICMTIISWAMRLAPFAVFGMMAQVSATTGFQALQNMALYVATCFAGFSVFLVFYGLLVWLFKGLPPWKFYQIVATPLLLAFSTSSSAATMPVTMKTAEDDLGVEPAIARFLIPLGITVNMAGSAIWHTSAVIFLSQAYDVDLGLAQISIVAGTSIASAIGSPGVPGVGIGILATVLAKVGIPIEGISLILGVDRIIDMGCTAVNVAGDLTAGKLFSRTKITAP